MSDPEPEKTPQEVAKKKAALVRAQANGFGQGKSVSPAKKTATERIDEAFDDDLDRLIRKVKRAFERGLDSDNTKLAVDTADKILKHLHQPATKVSISNEGGGDTVFNINVDKLSAEDLALFQRAKSAKNDEDIIDAEVVEE